MKILKVFTGFCVSILMLSAAQADSTTLEAGHPRPGAEPSISRQNVEQLSLNRRKYSIPYSEQEYVDAINSEVENNTLYDIAPLNALNGRKQLGELNVKEMLLRLKSHDGV